MPDEHLQPDLLALLREHTPAGAVIATVSTGKPNWVIGVEERGVWIETEASRTKGTGAQLVPAWMIQIAWDHLRRHGTLDNTYLLASSGLNVKRSSAVCALLVRLPDVSLSSTRPIRLAYAQPSSS
jgi:hypothetical protein